MPQAKTTRLWAYGLYVEVVGARSGARTKVVLRNSHPSMDRWGVNAYYNNVGIPALDRRGRLSPAASLRRKASFLQRRHTTPTYSSKNWRSVE